MALSDIRIRKAKAGKKAVKLSDGHGLTLIVRPSGTKTWKLRYRHDGRERDLTLGSYPQMGLADAREAAEAARTIIATGSDPLAERRRDEARQKAAASNTFQDQAEAYIASRSNWSEAHRSRFVHRMTRDVYPLLGAVPIGEIQALDVVAVAQKIVDRGAIDTAKRVCGMISQIAMRSIVLGFASSNPAVGVASALGDSPAVQHRPALVDAADLRPFLRAVDEWPGRTIAKALVQMILLVFQRCESACKIDPLRWVMIV